MLRYIHNASNDLKIFEIFLLHIHGIIDIAIITSGTAYQSRLLMKSHTWIADTCFEGYISFQLSEELYRNITSQHRL